MPRPMKEVKYFAPINVMALGVMYATTREAGIALGVSSRTIWRRINNPDYPDYTYVEHGMWTTKLVPDNTDAEASRELKEQIRQRAIEREQRYPKKVYVDGGVFANQRLAAAALGISRTTLRRMIRSAKHPNIFLVEKQS